MNKYRIIGILNIALGCLIFPFVPIIAIIMPRTNSMYKEIGMTSLPDYTLTFLALGILVITSIISFIIGSRCLRELPEKEKNHKRALISFFITLLTDAILIAVMVYNLLLPFYDLAARI